MERVALGASDLVATRLGFGALQAGDPALGESECARLLNGVLDLGIALIDTAPSYGLSEERIGRHLAARRGEFLLSTKVGYGVPGHADWTPGAVVAGVERARERLATDVLDLVFLHSCPAPALADGALLDALAACRERGWLRLVGYSGEGAAADLALAHPALGALQTSWNWVDQASAPRLAAARARGIATLAKRPLFGLPWSRSVAPADPALAEYWRRFQRLRPARAGHDWPTLALRFAAFGPGVDACLVGGTHLGRLAANCAAVEAGPLPAAEVEAIRGAWAAHAADWEGVV